MNQGKTWDEWKEVLSVQSRELECSDPPFGLETLTDGFEPFLRMLFRAEKECRVESDAAVKVFVATGAWPEQGVWTEYFNFLRFLCAIDFASHMSLFSFDGIVPKSPLLSYDASVLTWLLTEYWELSFGVWLKLYAVSMFHSLPFYELEPAVPRYVPLR